MTEIMCMVCNAKAFEIEINNKSYVQHEPDETLGVDVTIILGKDINSFSHISEYISHVSDVYISHSAYLALYTVYSCIS